MSTKAIANGVPTPVRAFGPGKVLPRTLAPTPDAAEEFGSSSESTMPDGTYFTAFRLSAEAAAVPAVSVPSRSLRTGICGATVILSVPALAEAKVAVFTMLVPTFSTLMPAIL